MTRLLGGVLICFAAGIMGFSASNAVARHCRLYRDLQRALQRMRGEIGCTRPPVSELCQLIACGSGQSAPIFRDLGDLLRQDTQVQTALTQVFQRYGITGEVYTLWRGVMEAVTRFDAAQVLQILDAASERMAELCLQTESACRQTIRLYRVFGLCAGGTLAILLV